MLDLNLEEVFVLSLSKPGLLLNANLTCCFKVLNKTRMNYSPLNHQNKFT